MVHMQISLGGLQKGQKCETSQCEWLWMLEHSFIALLCKDAGICPVMHNKRHDLSGAWKGLAQDLIVYAIAA